ncbi:MAG: hypothetical protein AAGH99_04490 [Planctomycetota bacterium]
MVYAYFTGIRDQLEDRINEFIGKHDEIDDLKIDQIFDKVIDSQIQFLDGQEFLDGFQASDAAEVIKQYREEISECRQEVFQKLKIDNTKKHRLDEIAGSFLVKSIFTDSHAGVVFAGFGDNELFPVCARYRVEGIILGKLRIKEDKITRVTADMTASVIPFAQQDMVAAFMRGVDPMLADFTDAYLMEVLKRFPEIVVRHLFDGDRKKIKELSVQFEEIASELFSKYIEKLESVQNREFVQPIVNTVASLPKDELAIMAETLVNLTSFKKRVSGDIETVGGPVDVAVISKGDGFIWIKRKQYFSPEINNAFVGNYLRKD